MCTVLLGGFHRQALNSQGCRGSRASFGDLRCPLCSSSCCYFCGCSWCRRVWENSALAKRLQGSRRVSRGSLGGCFLSPQPISARPIFPAQITKRKSQDKDLQGFYSKASLGSPSSCPPPPSLWEEATFPTAVTDDTRQQASRKYLRARSLGLWSQIRCRGCTLVQSPF